MKKGQKQYGEAFKEKVRQLKEEGKTIRHIAEEMGVDYEVIKQMIKR